jgi:hypothetical protein
VDLTLSRQMAARLSALRTGRALPPLKSADVAQPFLNSGLDGGRRKEPPPHTHCMEGMEGPTAGYTD